MTEAQATLFAEFVKDHDKRFEAKVRPDGDGSAVRLTLAADGTVLEPISEVAAYQKTYIDKDPPGPTVTAAWEQWQARVKDNFHGG